MRRRLLIGAVGFIVVIVIALAVAIPAAVAKRSVAGLRQLSEVISVVPAFLRDRTTRGQRLPPSVSLRELIASGYIRAGGVPALNGMEITLVFAPDEVHVDQTLIRVLDGSNVIAVARMADGRIVSKFPLR